MDKKKETLFPLSLEAPVPEIYMPRLQLFVRLLLGALVALYINYSPVPPLVLSVNQVNLSLVFYYAFHLLWWWYYRKYGANIIMFRLGGWIDILGAFIGALSDPFTIPPMILLFLIAALGNGIQHGLYFFVESMIGSLILAGAVPVRCGVSHGGSRPLPDAVDRQHGGLVEGRGEECAGGVRHVVVAEQDLIGPDAQVTLQQALDP